MSNGDLIFIWGFAIAFSVYVLCGVLQTAWDHITLIRLARAYDPTEHHDPKDIL